MKENELADFHALARLLPAAVLAVAAMMGTSMAVAQAEKYPSRPVKLIVPIGAGSATDSLARQLAEALRAELKGDFIVENKTGAGGSIGADTVARARPDGYTLGVFFSSVLTASPAISSKLPYDPRKDFTPIAIVASNPIVLAVPTDSPYNSLDEFLAAARKELWAAFAPQVRGGKLRLLATATALKEQPTVPTFASKGFQRANMDVLSVVVGPAGMSSDVTATLAKALEKIVGDSNIAASIEKLGYLVTFGSPQELARHVNEEITLLTKVARDANIKGE